MLFKNLLVNWAKFDKKTIVQRKGNKVETPMNHHNDVVRREAATFKRSNVDINSSSKVNKTRKYEDKEYSHLSTIKGISVHRASEVDLINGLTTCLISFLPLKIRVRVNFFYHRPT